MTSTSDEVFRKHIASFNDMAVAEEWKRRYEAHDSLVKALEEAPDFGGKPTTAFGRQYRAWQETARAALSQAKGGK